MTDVFVGKAKEYIQANHDQPFFLFFPSQDIHVPRAPHPRFQGTTELSYRGDAMVQFDWATGEIMKTLDELGIADNTIVIFSSDNGPVYDDGYEDGTTVRNAREEVDRGHDGSGIWRGGKYQIYEGGTRVPFIIRWPAQIVPDISDATVSQVSFMASFAELLGVPLPDTAARDSRNTLAAFLGKDSEGLPYLVKEARAQRSLREGPWKFKRDYTVKREPHPPELFNLALDPSEQNNLIEAYPEIAASMAAQLDAIISGDGIR